MHRLIKGWVEKGCPNAAHLDALLDAEMAAYKGKAKMAKEKYKTFINLSARGGLLLDAGLSCERYGEFLLGTQVGSRNDEDAIFQLRRAIQYYQEVGAQRKVVQVDEKFAHLWSPPTETARNDRVGEAVSVNSFDVSVNSSFYPAE